MRAGSALLAGLAVAVLALPGPVELRLRGLRDGRPARPGSGGGRPRPAGSGPSPVAPRSGSSPVPPRLLAAGLGLAAVGTVLLVGAVPVLLGAGALAVGRVLVQRARDQRERDLERAAAVEACDALAAELRAGRAAGEALQAAAAVARGACGAALAAAGAMARLGGDVPGALLAGVGPSSVPELLRGLAACWQVCAGTGSGLAAAVERLADGQRARQQQREAVASALAGPRASAGLLAVLPLGGLALAAGLGAHPVHLLLHTPLGLACLLLGTGLDALGVLWTRRLVDRAAAA